MHGVGCAGLKPASRTCSPIGSWGLRLGDRSRMSREAHVRFSEGVGVRFPRATRPSESLRRRPRSAGRHWFLDDLLQFSTPSPGDEQPDADGGVARRHGQNRRGGEGCGYAASLGQRKRVAHIPTAETEAARSGLILEGQGQAKLHLKSNGPWSHEWGPLQTMATLTRRIVSGNPSSTCVIQGAISP